MKNILKTSSLMIGLLLIDAKLSIISACTDEERQEYQNCEQACVNAGSGTVGCDFGCWIYGLVYGCLSGNEEENRQFKKYLDDSTFKKFLGEKIIQMQGKKVTPQDFSNAYEEYQEFVKSGQESTNKKSNQDKENTPSQNEKSESTPSLPEKEDSSKKRP
jgi:hypothetical protein